MENPPDFVMYVVMMRVLQSDSFEPYWGDAAYAQGFAKKVDANRLCKELRRRYGKDYAYVQQYGPYK